MKQNLTLEALRQLLERRDMCALRDALTQTHPADLAELAALPGLQLTSSNDHDFELVAKGVDKGRALALLSMMYGVPLCDCAGVGDSDNDLAMLQAVGTPIAMGNAAPAVKAAACRIAPSNTEDGVAQAILSCLNTDAQ